MEKLYPGTPAGSSVTFSGGNTPQPSSSKSAPRGDRSDMKCLIMSKETILDHQ